MRIGIDAANVHGGGGVNYLKHLLTFADPARDNFESITIWGSRGTLGALPEREWLNRRVIRALSLPLPVRAAWQATHTPRYSREFDVLFLPGGVRTGSFHPYVTMSRNMLPFQPEEAARYGASTQRLRLALLRRVQARTFRNADGVIFLTDFARKTIEEAVGRLGGEVRVIPHGVSEVFVLQPRPARDVTRVSMDSPLHIVYTSTINHYKHQWNVVAAVERLRRRAIPVRLTLIGPEYGSAVKRLQQTIAATDPAGAFVRRVPNLPQDQLARVYADADLFIFASTCENLPNILLEAMAAGLPIVCSDRPPMPAIARDSAKYFNPVSVDSTAAALEAALQDRGWREASAQRAHSLAKEYSWQRTARATFSLLRTVHRRRESLHADAQP